MTPPSDRQRFQFRKQQRLLSTAQFRHCYDGQRAGDQHLLIFAVANQLSCTRIGVSVSKKHGNAVNRNRRKRLLREAFRRLQHELPCGYDFVLVPRQTSDPQLVDYCSSLKRICRRLARRIGKTDREA